MSREASTSHFSPFAQFVVLTFVITWTAWGTVIAVDPEPPLRPVLTLLGGVGPLLAAGILSWRDGTLRKWASRAVRWRVPARWWIAAVVLPVVLSLLGWGIYVVLEDVSIGLTTSPIYIVYPTVFLLVFFLQGGYGEEMGWRGYALPHLLERYNALVAGLFVGVVWAVWHLPQFFIQGSSQGGSFLVYLTGVVGLSIILTWLFVNGHRSVLVVVVFHAQWNVFDSGALFEFAAAPGLVAPATSTALIWAFALVLIAIYGSDLRSPGSLGNRPSGLDEVANK